MKENTVICEFFEKSSAEASKLPNCTLILNTIRQIAAYKSQQAAMGNSATQHNLLPHHTADEGVFIYMLAK